MNGVCGTSTVSIEDLARFVYGSNAIEKAGTTERMTYKLCMKVFGDEPVDVHNIDVKDDSYSEELQHQINVNKVTVAEAQASVLRGREEAVTHAQAAKYFLGAIVHGDQRLTEELLRATHKILLEKSEHEVDGGVYRQDPCAATASSKMFIEPDDEYEKRIASIKKKKGLPPDTPLAIDRITKPKYMSTFVRPASIPHHMKNLIEQFNRDIGSPEESGTTDPVGLATRYCHYFVCIHPFVDGNGRMCRLLLNAVLMKHAGVCVAIGVDADERAEYTMCAWRANARFVKEDRDDVPLQEQEGHVELGEMILQKVRDQLAGYEHRLSQKRSHVVEERWTIGALHCSDIYWQSI